MKAYESSTTTTTVDTNTNNKLTAGLYPERKVKFT